MKKILKELVIIILLCVIIVILLSIIFYDRIVQKVSLPIKPVYQTNELITNYLEQNVVATEKEELQITYEIDSTDLTVYQKTNQYVPGKIDPFAQEKAKEENVIETSDNTIAVIEENETENTNTTSGTLFKTPSGK